MSRHADDILMGAKLGQMNLRAVKLRAEEIRRTIDTLLQTLQFAPGTLQWNDVVDKFAVLNVQLQHLSAQIRPLLQHYLAHPRSVNQSNAPILPIMLATKALPEQETTDYEVLEETRKLSSVMKIPGASFGAMAEAINSAVAGLTGDGGLLDPKGRTRAGLAAAAREAVIERNNQSTAIGDAILGGIRDTIPSSGAQPPVQIQGPELLLAAATYGAGLA